MAAELTLQVSAVEGSADAAANTSRVRIDLAITTENILLEITSLNLGGVWLAVAPFPERMAKVDEALGIGENLHAFALVPVGVPAEDRPQEDRYDETRIHYKG